MKNAKCKYCTHIQFETAHAGMVVMRCNEIDVIVNTDDTCPLFLREVGSDDE